MEVAEGKKILTDYMELDIIEIPKIYELKNTSKENKLLEWLYFLENPNSERVKNIMEENEGIQEARDRLEEISNDEIMQRLADWQESAEREEVAIRNMAYREGRKEGIQEATVKMEKKMQEEKTKMVKKNERK